MEQVISYRELKSTSDAVIHTICAEAGIDPLEVSISSAINGDLGVDGDDWVDLAAVLVKKHDIKLEGLHFYKHFQDEGQISDPSGFFLRFLFFIFYITFFQWVNQKFSDFYDVDPKKEPLTIGDIIASKYAGRFVRRSEVRFVLA